MTTPEIPREAPASAADPAAERITRPEPQAGGPNRGGPRPGPLPGEPAQADASVSESVAHAVRMGYDVITENIRQGREAAAKFRQGDYNMRDVPGDVETALLRVIQLARELSTTSFDVCERLVREIGPLGLPGDGVDPAPAFWPTPKSPPASAPAAEVADHIPLTVRFTGEARAQARTTRLERPRRPTLPEEVFATPLQARDLAGGTITELAFVVDMSVAGLVAEIRLPDGIAAGVYSGLVYARNDEAPLGALSVEILP